MDQEHPTSHETGREGEAGSIQKTRAENHGETLGQGPGATQEPQPQTRAERQAAAAARIKHQQRWVELQIKGAMERGAFDNLPGLGKPIPSLGAAHDPDWWLKQFIERENVTGVLPPALQLRKDDELLDARLDKMSAESDVRRELEDFNERVRAAFYQPLGGPPLITKQRDVGAEILAWRKRRHQ